MRILLADDDNAFRRVLQFKLKKHGYEVTAVENGSRALEKLREDTWDLLLSDIKMPDVDGIELLEHAGKLQPDLKVILITAHATISQAVQSVKLGAFDYITKPFEDDELLAVIDKAVAFRKLENENRLLKGRLEHTEGGRRPIGVSKAFKEMMAIVDKIASTDATVLLSGPSGTGKELVARTIHAESGRAGRDFIAVNCGAIPSELMESELFGHVKGAFTGAVRDKKGKFELADGGTILLDEIGDMPVELQVKLLRVLQEHFVQPVGSEQMRPIDVRVIAATNSDLRKRVAQGAFRDDLFYRLNVIPIKVPGLAERREDIPLLAREFVRRFAPEKKVTISPQLMERLSEYSWPGNIRELGNLIERMVILRESDTLTVSDLPKDLGAERPVEQAPEEYARNSHLTSAAAAKADSDASDYGSQETRGRDSDTPRLRSHKGTGSDQEERHLTFHEAQEKLIREALDRSGWNRTKAAKRLNIPRHVLLYRIKKYKIVEE
jgi:two-component system NtrC family response regulator